MSNGRLEWNEARLDIQNTLARLREELDALDDKVHEQDKKILALQIKVGYISAGIALAVSILVGLAEHFGLRSR